MLQNANCIFPAFPKFLSVVKHRDQSVGGVLKDPARCPPTALTELCRPVLFCRLVELNQQVTENVKC